MKAVEKNAHIRLDEQVRPWIDDTNVKVIEVVLDHLGYGWNARRFKRTIRTSRSTRFMPHSRGITTTKPKWTPRLRRRMSAFRRCAMPPPRPRCNAGWPRCAAAHESCLPRTGGA